MCYTFGMSFYPRTNFAKGNLTGTLPSAVATSITLASGKGALFPDADTDGSFPAVLWNVTDYPDPSDDPDVEIVLVTSVITDTFEITRAQEGTTAKAHNTSGKTYRLALAPTAAVIQQLVDASVTVETPTGSVNGANTTFTVTAEPKWIVADGIIYFAGLGYSYNALTVTMDIAPSYGIRAII